MSLKDIMTKTVVTVEADDDLWTVQEIFLQNRFHHLLVLEHGKVFGIVSDRDLLKALSPNLGTNVETPKDLATLNKKVHHIMSRKPLVLKEDASIFDAVDLFNNNTISCIPVVDDQMRPLGIISWRDILRAIGTRRSLREEQGRK